MICRHLAKCKRKSKIKIKIKIKTQQQTTKNKIKKSVSSDFFIRVKYTIRQCRIHTRPN